MPKGYALSAPDIVRLRKLLDAFEAGNLEHQPAPPTRRNLPGPVPFHIGKAGGTISAGSSGSVTLWKVNSAGTEVADTETVTAYDWFGTGATSGDKLYLWRHWQSARWYFALDTQEVADAAVAGITVPPVGNWYGTASATSISSTSETVLSLSQVWTQGSAISVASNVINIDINDAYYINLAVKMLASTDSSYSIGCAYRFQQSTNGGADWSTVYQVNWQREATAATEPQEVLFSRPIIINTGLNWDYRIVGLLLSGGTFATTSMTPYITFMRV